MKRLLVICAFLSAFAITPALSAFFKVFEENYKVTKDSTLDKAACGVCHMGAKGGKLNPYGKDIQTAMKDLKTKKLTDEALKKVEKLDSDGDKVTNIDEIKKDSLPGTK